MYCIERVTFYSINISIIFCFKNKNVLQKPFPGGNNWIIKIAEGCAPYNIHWITAAEICYSFIMLYLFTLECCVAPVYNATNCFGVWWLKLKTLVHLPGPCSISPQQTNSYHNANCGCSWWRWPGPHVPALHFGEQHPWLQPHHLSSCYPWINWSGKTRANTLSF